jgi:hypothetical protein
MNIQEIRQKYPQYSDLSDEQLADGLHKKYYSDLPKEEFLNKIGFKPKEAPLPVQAGPTVLSDTDTSSDFVRGLTNYFPQLQELGGAAEALTGVGLHKLGATDTGKSLIEGGLKTMESGKAKQVSKESDDFLKAYGKGIGTVITDWLPYQMGAGVANVAETLGFSALGALAGTAIEPGAGTATGAFAGALSKTMVKSGISKAAEAIAEKEGEDAAKAFVKAETKKLLEKQLEKGVLETYSKAGAKSIGSTTGMIGQAGLHGMGEVGSRVFDEEKQRAEAEGRQFKPEDIDAGRVAPAVLVHGIADFFFNKIGLDSMKIGSEATKSLALDIAKRIGVTGAKEIPAEELQTLAERYGAGLSLTDKEALDEYINTAAASVGMSVVPGGVGGARTHMAVQKAKALEELRKTTQNTQQQTELDTKTTETKPKLDAETEALLTPAVPVNQETKSAETTLAATTEDSVTATKETTPDKTTETKVDETTESKEATIDQRIAKRTSELEELEKKREALGFKPKLRRNSSEKIKQIVTEIEALDNEIADVKQTLWFLHSGKESRTEGEQNAGKTVGDTGGTSTAVAVPADTGSATTTAGETKPSGVATVAPTIVNTNGRTELQSPTVTDEQKMLSGLKPPERVNTTPGYVRTEQSDEDNLKAAMELAAQYEKSAEEDRQKNLAESKVNEEGKTKTIPRYEVLKEGEESKSGRYEITPEMREEYDLTRDAKREEGVLIPAWDDLTTDEKDVYFDNIRRNTIEEHNNAADVLNAYRKKKGVDKLKLTPEQQRFVNAYEQNRAISSKLFGIEFPAWADLTNEDKQIYLQQIINNAGLQQDVGFAHLGAHLLQKERRMTNDQKHAAVLRIVEVQNRIEQEHKENKEKYDKLNESNLRTATQGLVPDTVIAHIKGNNIQGVLQFMRTSANNRFFRNIAQAIFSMKLNTEIKMVDKLPGKDLAIYDPASDTIYVTPFGATETVLMHELVHAATIKVLHTFLTKNGVGLTRAQIEAAEHLQDIMDDTRKLFAKQFPEAYKSLYEFVSYSMTNKAFQIELGKLRQTAERAETILPEKKSMWSEFKLRVAELLGATKELFKRGNLNMNAPINYRMEIEAAFEDIMSVPKAGEIQMKPLPATGPSNGIEGENTSYNPDRHEAIDGKAFVKKLFTTTEGWRRIATWLVDRRTHAKYLHDMYDAAGKISRDLGGKFTNFYEWAVNSAAMGENAYINRVQDIENKAHSQIVAYTQLLGNDLKHALNRLHRITEALHEPERRFVKWLLTVPLNTDPILTQNGKQISPAERRVQIVGDERYGVPGLIHKAELTDAQLKALRDELTHLANTYADGFGDSPRISEKIRERLNRPPPPGKTKQGIPTDIKDGMYNVLGLEQSEVALRQQQIADMKQNNPAEYKATMDILATMRELHEVTKELNKEGNYWSMPVANLVGLYGFENYMPFKGKDRGKKQADDILDFDSRRNGRELQEFQAAMEGRFSVSDNPILQSLSDAIRAAGRAGRKYYTQSIKNAIDAGIIPGEIKHFEFWQRDSIDMKKYKGEDYIFHYNQDGSLDILKVTDQKLLNSLRYTYQDANTLLDVANKVTGFFGSLHTRYNYNFAPINFVRDTLFNTFNIGADRGPTEAFKYAASIAGNIVANNGLPKAWKVAMLHDKGDPASKALLAKMSQSDGFVRNMVEYLEHGGKTSYTQSFSLKSNLENLSDSVGKSGMVTKLDQFNNLMDIWNNMFEFTSRAAVYAQEKERALKEQIANGLSDKKGPNGEMSPAEKAAAFQAATYAKEMTNFEQKGTYSRGLGALYMFIRPSAISAKRAIEAVAPAFRNIDDVVAGLPANIQNDKVAEAKFRTAYAEKQRNARIMITALSGAGYLMYMMAEMMAPDDEWGRNLVKNDNMQQWTRNARFHIPNSVSVPMGLGKDIVFQVPWGFGLGAFAASGAQVAGMTRGNTSLSDGLSNMILSIMADSFVPIPISKIPPSEMPLAFAIDSMMPTVVRPLTEFLMNKNGLGQDINSATARRLGDAYTGGDNIPEIYKKVAQELFKADVPGVGVGGISISPNTLYFFTNSYLDGIGKLGELAYSMTDLSRGAKEFNPKTDVPLIGSFFGSKANVDSREFSSVSKQLENIQRKINTFDTQAPVEGLKYDMQHPMHRIAVDIYKSQIVELNKVRGEANAIRNMPGITPKQRDQLLKIYILQENMIKHEMISMFKTYGIKP